MRFNLEYAKFCPGCGVSWQGNPIPEASQEAFGGHTHFSRLIGIEVQGSYDGVSYWKCPDCATVFDRWTGMENFPSLSEEI